MSKTIFPLGVSVILLAFACNEVPVGNLTSSYMVQIEELREKASPAKLDILWVVDDSPSMCQEQQGLANSFEKFLSIFQEFAAIDMRLAVTTSNFCGPSNCKESTDCGSGNCGVLNGENVCFCTKNSECGSQECKQIPGGQVCIKSGAVRGKFVYRPATEFPPECVQKRVVPCLDDAACQNNPSLPDAKNWVCDPKPAQYMYTCDKPENIGTDNYPGDVLHTINSLCRYRCDKVAAPADCARIFGAPSGCDETCGDSCSIPDCQADDSLQGPNSCGELCGVGTDCDATCGDVLKDAALCQEICALDPGDCMNRCEEISKAPKCENVCSTNWDCIKKCETYLFDTARCASVCATGDCYATCTDEFSKQDFLCSLVCESGSECDDRCIAEFGGSTFRCLYPGGDQQNAGCLLPPLTQHCPKDGPLMLDREVADRYFEDWKSLKWAGDPAWQNLDDESVRGLIFEQLFICMASVGAAQNICGSQEQGLAAALAALDKSGENSAQAASFLRDDAFLLIIFVSDEDDCSASRKIPAIDAGKCACLADSHGCTPNGQCNPEVPGPLIPASSFINRIKSLKPDPAQVVVAAIVGDVVPGSFTSPSEDPAAIRERFYECKCDKGLYAPFTYGCLSPQGKADIGNRYIQVTGGFGPRYGRTSNICDDQGLSGALTEIAELVVPLLTAICLPRPLHEDENVDVYLVNEYDERFPQIQETATDLGDYKLVKNFPACPKFDATQGYRTENAIQFTESLDFLARVQITYQAEAFYIEE